MDDNARKLLDEKRTIILPGDLNHDAYEMIVEAALLYPDDEIDLYCRGDGGDARDGFAIVDVIRQHGRFIGLLTGESNSSHVTVWAGCNTRYVYPLSAIGVHRIGSQKMKGTITAEVLEFMKKDYEYSENAVSEILAEISDKDVEFWNNQQRMGNVTYKTTMFYADELIEMGMALPIADRPREILDRVGKPVSTLDGNKAVSGFLGG